MKSFAFPGNIESEILEIGNSQIPYMRTQEFSSLVKECETMLLSLINCKNGKTIIYTASGTGAMDAVVSNYVGTKHKAFIIAGGSFGYRWKDICEYYNYPYYLFEVPFAKDIDYEELECQVKKECPDVLLCQHHETSSGQLFDLSKISGICKRNQVSLVVDAISSFLAEPLDMDRLGIDICITSSQKGLNIPPGLSILFLSEKVVDEGFCRRNFYFDFDENLKNLSRGQTPYSPATILFLQLHARLKQISEIGIVTVFDQVKRNSIFFKRLCRKMGWNIPAENSSSSITGFFVNRNGDKIFRSLIDLDIYIMPSSQPDFFRVSHLGLQSEEDLKELAQYIKEIEQY